MREHRPRRQGGSTDRTRACTCVDLLQPLSPPTLALTTLVSLLLGLQEELGLPLSLDVLAMLLALLALSLVASLPLLLGLSWGDSLEERKEAFVRRINWSFQIQLLASREWCNWFGFKMGPGRRR
jgi:hypothetical protein